MSLLLTDLPAKLGFRMPAEWEPHAATWLAWPHKEDSWPGLFAEIPAVWAEMTAALVTSEEVRILVRDPAMEDAARRTLEQRLGDLTGVRFYQVPTNDAWIRDHGPIFVVRDNGSERQLAAIDWKYNAWGGKYAPWDDDDAVPRRIAALLGIPVASPGIVLEGGSIDVNGCGSLLTTEQCLLNPNRNPQLGRREIEEALRGFLGIQQVLWLGEGIVGDDTDGHVDDLARFVAARTIVAAYTDDPSSPDYHALRDNWQRLERMRDLDGRPFELVRLPMPEPVHFSGQQLPASYANFYIANRAVLVPTFDCPQDATALAILREIFPNRRVVGIPSRALVWGLGAIHCVTQQQPAASSPR